MPRAGFEPAIGSIPSKGPSTRFLTISSSSAGCSPKPPGRNRLSFRGPIAYLGSIPGTSHQRRMIVKIRVSEPWDDRPINQTLPNLNKQPGPKPLNREHGNCPANMSLNPKDRNGSSLNLLAKVETLSILYAAVFLTRIGLDRKSTRLNSSHIQKSRMPSSA